MRRKPGVLSARERKFAEAYVDTGKVGLAGQIAGYSNSGNNVGQILKRPEVAETVRQIQEKRLNNEVLPKAIALLERVLTDDGAKDRDRITAAKIVLDRTIGMQRDSTAEKAPEDMTSDEIAARLAHLRAIQAKAMQGVPYAEIVDDDAPDQGDIFG